MIDPTSSSFPGDHRPTGPDRCTDPEVASTTFCDDRAAGSPDALFSPF
jgi:hypothetical protein